MRDIEIVLIGNRGAGKTTLLATMARELDKNEKRFDVLRLKPQDSEFSILNQRWSDQLEKLKKDHFFTAEYAGTSGIITHPFIFTNGKESLPCNFVDTPGGQTFSGGHMEDIEKNADNLKERVKNADALICVVDAVSLMESGCLDSTQNACAVPGIKKLLEEAAKDSQVSCLFVLTKCEKYTHSFIQAKNTEALVKKFHECFEQILEIKNLTSYYLPVETLGCFKFACFEEENGKQVRKWDRIAEETKPVNTLVPLCFAMKKLLKNLENQKPWYQKMWESIFKNEDYEEYTKLLIELIKEAKWMRIYKDGELKKMTLQEMSESIK